MKRIAFFAVLAGLICFSIPSFAQSVSVDKETQKWIQIEKQMIEKIRQSDLPATKKQELIEFFHILIVKKQLEIWVDEIGEQAGKVEVPELPQIPMLE